MRLRTQQQSFCLGVGRIPFYLGRWEREEKKWVWDNVTFKRVFFEVAEEMSVRKCSGGGGFSVRVAQ